MDCKACGGKMLHYENPSRWLCPRQNKHIKLEIIRVPDREADRRGIPPNR